MSPLPAGRTTARRASLRRLAVAGAAVALPLVLTGCGAGFDAQTYQNRNVADGTNADVGEVGVRNMSVEPPASGDYVHAAGSDALVHFTLVNEGSEPDRLVSATSAVASSVQLVEGRAQTPVTAVPLPANSSTGQYALVLQGLRQEVRTGSYVPVTLTFARAGELRVRVAVALTGEAEQREKSKNFHLEGE